MTKQVPNDTPRHFFNLLPAPNLKNAMYQILAGLRIIYVILRDNVQKYINIDETRIKKLENNMD